MIFQTRGKSYKGRSAIEVVRALERDDEEYRYCGGPIRQYLSWSLKKLGGSVPPRELALSDRLDDETLDEYGLGAIVSDVLA